MILNRFVAAVVLLALGLVQAQSWAASLEVVATAPSLGALVRGVAGGRVSLQQAQSLVETRDLAGKLKRRIRLPNLG